ncbi:MAG: NusG domain II-containing protein [Oscillospiraceae bacterium]
MQTDNKNETQPQRFFKKGDLLIIGGIVLAAALLLVFFVWNRSQGGTAQVTLVTSAGTEVTEISLAEDKIVHIEGAPFAVTLEVSDGRIRFIESQCPDHICENVGWLQYEGDEAICLPAKVWLKIV